MDRQVLVRIERRLRAGFDFHGGTNIVVLRGGDARIPKQQALAVWVIRIYDDARPVPFDSGLRKGRADDAFELAQERFLEVFAARGLDGVKLGMALLSAQGFEFLNGRGLSEVFTKDRDVDIF